MDDDVKTYYFEGTYGAEFVEINHTQQTVFHGVYRSTPRNPRGTETKVLRRELVKRMNEALDDGYKAIND